MGRFARGNAGTDVGLFRREGETANADDSKYRMDILLELHGIQYRGGEHEGKTRVSRLLAKGVTKTQSSSFSPLLGNIVRVVSFARIQSVV